ncbi:MAG: YndJ family transporter [Labilithrix sp.]|nr:YndJ family transporter [Labilithrix sp.]MCW5812829.1 YndJ family transporter [Labilithrix sp.]
MPALILMLASGVAVPLGLALTLTRRSNAAADPLERRTLARRSDDAADPLERRTLARRSDDAADGPLGRGVLARVALRGASGLRVVAPVGAVGGVLGWLAAPGSGLAIAGAAAYALVCVAAGVLGLARVLPDLRARAVPELAIDVGLLFLPAAAVWLLAARAGVPLAGFHEPVVTFTAAHFHFAGFAAPTILGHVGHLVEERPRALYRVATVAVCAGVPLTAIGIATNHTVEQIAAVTVALGMLAAAIVLVGFAARRAEAPLAKVLFVVSGTTLLLTMTLAACFALTSSAGRGSSLQGIVPLQTMIDYHGGANAIGFALSGLCALTLQRLRARATAVP